MDGHARSAVNPLRREWDNNTTMDNQKQELYCLRLRQNPPNQ
jgi:hypothetical protein